MEDRCVVCRDIIPEGMEICPLCYKKWLSDEDIDLDILLHRIKKKKHNDKSGDEQLDDN